MNATPVTVTGTLVDSSGASWDNATIIIQFVPGFGTPITRYQYNNASFTLRQELVATGNTFSVSLPANNDIIPIDSMWQFTISKSPNTPAIVLTKFFSSKDGTTFDISSDFSAAPLPTPAIPAGAQVIQVASESEALSQSAANPNNIYWWA